MKKQRLWLFILAITLSLDAVNEWRGAPTLSTPVAGHQVKISGTAKISGTVNVTGQASGGETNFVNDTFTETSDTELSLHTGELGATWTQHTSYAAQSRIDAAADQVYPIGDPSAYWASGSPPSANYCAEAVIKVESIISANAGIAVRMDTAANNMYIFQLNNGTGWRTRKIIAPSTQTTLGTEDTTTEIPSVGQTKTIKLCVSGSTLTPFVNGTQITSATATDSSITAAGKAGMRFVGTFSSSTGYHFQSFRAFTP